DGLRRPRKYRSAARQKLRVVAVPVEALIEHPLSLRKADPEIRIRIDEDVRMIERRDQLDMGGEQHGVAEDIARHVADADHREVLSLRVHAQLTEVTLHGLPAAPSG